MLTYINEKLHQSQKLSEVLTYPRGLGRADREDRTAEKTLAQELP